ncbi:MAG: A24 family peptidase [Gemmataceae bacterium]|nr:A24 family peptidase [Gemmataceae bacterium]MDW8266440.1 A24 family peptidase [Gemmataceae bacterium]
MSSWLDPANWPIWFICVAMVLAAVIDGWKLKVPNWLTFPLILSGWGLGLVHTLGYHLGENGSGGLLDSFLASIVGLLLLLPLYAIGGMGAGDVKMQAGFGAWIGAFFRGGEGLWIVVWAFFLGAIIGGVIGLGMMLARGRLRHNLQNMRTILASLVSTGSLEQIGNQGDELRAKEPKLPYGIPLCIGFLCYLVFFVSLPGGRVGS